MTQRSTIKSLKVGEYVQLVEDGHTWIRGAYCRASGLYELQRWSDASHFIYRKGSVLVFHGFTF